MKTTGLSLFEQEDLLKESSIAHNNSLPVEKTQQTQSLEQTLQKIFPTNQQQNKLQKARTVLGETVKDVPDQELQIFITELQYLLDSWLDNYEELVFNGITLQKVLREQ